MRISKGATRKATTPINVWVTPEEKAQIGALAEQTGHSMSSLLRALGMGYSPPSTLDCKMVLELAKINADQGRLGGVAQDVANQRRAICRLQRASDAQNH